MILGQNDEPLLRLYFLTGNYLRFASGLRVLGVGTADLREWTRIRRFFAPLFLSGKKISVNSVFSSVAGGEYILAAEEIN